MVSVIESTLPPQAKKISKIYLKRFPDIELMGYPKETQMLQIPVHKPTPKIIPKNPKVTLGNSNDNLKTCYIPIPTTESLGCSGHCCSNESPSTVRRPSSETRSVREEENNCPICQEKLGCSDMIRLLCFHSFHYECILNWYKVALRKPDTVRTCPLCREYGGHLPLKFGETPINDIHHIKKTKIKCLNTGSGNLNYLSNLLLGLGTLNEYDYNVSANNHSTIIQCPAIIKSKSSKNFGKQCSNWAYGSSYCGVHKHLGTNGSSGTSG